MTTVISKSVQLDVLTDSVSNTLHTYTEEERSALVEHINNVLIDDESLEGRLPIDPNTDQIFSSVQDGLILWKALLRVGQRSSPNEQFTAKLPYAKPTSRWQSVPNLESVLKLGREVGIECSSISASNLFNGEAMFVLAILWQIVRKDLMYKVAVSATRFFQEAHMTAEVATTEPGKEQKILIAWFNYHLEQAQHPRRVSNFSSDISDSECYTVLLHQLAPETCDLTPLSEKDISKRAELMLQQADKLRCRKFVTPTDIVKGDDRLNTAFVAVLFTTFMSKNQPEEPEEPEEPENVQDISAESIDEVELEIRRLQEELHKTEQEAEQQEKIVIQASAILKQTANNLQNQIEEERKKRDQLNKKQDEEISKLRDKLDKLRKDNNAPESVEEIKLRILKEEEEKARMVKEAREREVKLEGLKEELENKEEIVANLERRKKELEKETQKMKQLHKVQLENLKKRLIKFKKEEEKLEDELEHQTQKTQTEEDKLFELKREEKSLNRELNTVLSDKERILETRRKLERAIRAVESGIEEQKDLQHTEAQKQTKAQVRLVKLQTEQEALLVQKTDLSIQNRLLNEVSEDVKNTLLEEQLDKQHVLNINKRLQQQQDEVTDELDNIAQDRLDDNRRAQKQAQYEVDKLKRDLATQKRKALAPVQKLEAEAEEAANQIMEEDTRIDTIKQQKDLLDLKQQQLAKMLIEVSTQGIEAKEEVKEAERDLTKVVLETEEEVRKRKQEEAQQRKLKLETKKLDFQQREEKMRQESLIRQAAELDEQHELLRGDINSQKSAIQNLRTESNQLQSQMKVLEQEFQEETKGKEKAVGDLLKKQKAELEHTTQLLTRQRIKAEGERKKLEEQLKEIVEFSELEKTALQTLASTAEKKERDSLLAERQATSASSDLSEAEKKKKALEEELAKAQKLTDNSSRIRTSKDRAKKTEMAAKKTTTALDDAEKRKSSLLEKRTNLELKMEELQAKTSELNSKTLQSHTAEKSRQELEDTLASITAEYSSSTENSKAKLRAKYASKTEDIRKKTSRDVDKLNRNAASTAKEVEEMQAALEEAKKLTEKLKSKTSPKP